MKSVIIALLCTIALSSCAQKIRYDLYSKSYVIVSKPKAIDRPTDMVCTYNGNVYPIWISKNGKHFINVISRTGNTYRKYLKIN